MDSKIEKTIISGAIREWLAWVEKEKRKDAPEKINDGRGFYLACANGRHEIAKTMLDSKIMGSLEVANIKSDVYYGLRLACGNNDSEVLRVILESGQEIGLNGLCIGMLACFYESDKMPFETLEMLWEWPTQWQWIDEKNKIKNEEDIKVKDFFKKQIEGQWCRWIRDDITDECRGELKVEKNNNQSTQENREEMEWEFAWFEGMRGCWEDGVSEKRWNEKVNQWMDWMINKDIDPSIQFHDKISELSKQVNGGKDEWSQRWGWETTRKEQEKLKAQCIQNQTNDNQESDDKLEEKSNARKKSKRL